MVEVGSMLHLCRPIVEHRKRGNDKKFAFVVVPPTSSGGGVETFDVSKARNGLDGFAQSHFISKNATSAAMPVSEEGLCDPIHAFKLVRL